MIIQKVVGGLGNQMFQYAFIKATSLRNNVDFNLDISEYTRYFRPYELEIFHIEKNYASEDEIPFYEKWHSKNTYLDFGIGKFKTVFKLLDKNYFQEKNLFLDRNFMDLTHGYIEGYFPTEKYFIDFERDIRKDFEFINQPKNPLNIKITQTIHDTHSVAIHFRRGDYMLSKNGYIGVQGVEYYQKAVEFIGSKVHNPVFFIFSDDIDWVRENFQLKYPYHYVDWNSGDESYEDMRLMSLCKHNIIANSTFSWWGAWLNKNIDKLVIAPRKWLYTHTVDYNDIIPEAWIRI